MGGIVKIGSSYSNLVIEESSFIGWGLLKQNREIKYPLQSLLESSQSNSTFPFKNQILDISTLFQTGIFSIFSSSDLNFIQSLGKDWLEFLKRVIIQTSDLDPSITSEYLVLLLALESARDVKSAKKMAKGFLKKNRNDLLLWNAYAQLEKMSNSFEETRKVYSTALSMVDFKSCNETHLDLLYLMFAEFEFECSRFNSAANICIAFIERIAPVDLENTKISSIKLLGAKRMFEESIHKIFKTKSIQSISSLISVF